MRTQQSSQQPNFVRVAAIVYGIGEIVLLIGVLWLISLAPGLVGLLIGIGFTASVIGFVLYVVLTRRIIKALTGAVEQAEFLNELSRDD